MHDKLCDVSAQLHAAPNDTSARVDLNNIDKQTVEIQAAGEKQCRKCCTGQIPFSLPVNYRIHKKWAYQALARVATGHCNNVGSALSKARKAGITSTKLSHEECLAGVEGCRQRLSALSKSSRGLRKVHLRDRLINTEDLHDEQKSKAIRAIILQEEQRLTWHAIKRVVNDPRLGAITKVDKETTDGTIEIVDIDGMVAEIQHVTKKRFGLAESAPVTNTSLGGSVGFLADTKFAIDLVSGKSDIPPDVDEPTTLVIKEIQRLWNDESNARFHTFQITKEDFCYYWRKAKELTSSSLSSIHFGHYKAATKSTLISEFLGDKLSVIGSYGAPPD